MSVFEIVDTPFLIGKRMYMYIPIYIHTHNMLNCLTDRIVAFMKVIIYCSYYITLINNENCECAECIFCVNDYFYLIV